MTDRRKTWLRLALWALVIAWMAVIFYFSAQAADDSDRTSGRVVSWLIDHFDRSFSSLSPEAQLLRMEDWSFAVRKLAHFCIFALLVSVVVYFVDSANNLLDFIPKEKLEESRFYPALLDLSKEVFPHFKELFHPEQI